MNVSHYLVRPTRKRNYEGKTVDEIQEENKEHSKINKELSNTIRIMRMELGALSEIKEKYEDQRKALAVLFERGYINEDGLPIDEHEQ